MPYVYSTTDRERDPHALPDVWVVEMTAQEIAEQMEEAIWDRRKRFPLAPINNKQYEAMLASIIEEEGVTGGWMWCYCSPGYMPESSFYGPFPTYAEAVEDAKVEHSLQFGEA